MHRCPAWPALIGYIAGFAVWRKDGDFFFAVDLY